MRHSMQTPHRVAPASPFRALARGLVSSQAVRPSCCCEAQLQRLAPCPAEGACLPRHAAGIRCSRLPQLPRQDTSPVLHLRCCKGVWGGN